ncbi:MAG: peptidylprolyl isomerase [Pseudomonadales bacterium]|jgi:cyclophilin family peptidyl-prolyl cis-trans isomerase|nr:peptidylprolyl isomerase [Pseudomonadales bacterium]
MPTPLPRTLIRLWLIAALLLHPWAAPKAQEALPEEATTPTLNVTFDGRAQQIQVEDPANPLVVIETTRGSLLFELFPSAAPATVSNFLGLANGSKTWVDPLTGANTKRPFYNGLSFHRVVNGVLIQGGSPSADAHGYPGFFVPDEINAVSLGLDHMSVLDPSGEPNPVLGIRSQADFQEDVLKPLYDSLGIRSSAQLEARVSEVDKKLRALSVQQLFELRGYRYRKDVISRAPVRGVIAMASTQPNQNGSQFFITLTDAEWLLGRHTVFGTLRAGEDVLDAIGRSPVDTEGRPQQEVRIVSIKALPR